MNEKVSGPLLCSDTIPAVRAYVNHTEEKTAVTQRFQEGDRVKLSPYGGGVVLSSQVRDGREWVTVRFFRRSLVKEIDASKGRLRKG